LGLLKDKQLKERPWYETMPYGAFWELGYQDINVSTLGEPSVEVVELVPALLPGARVLDLGCGEGRNALYLATRGCDVTAVDRSEAGLRKLSYMANRAGVSLTTHVADIATLDIEDEYALVMAHGFLHYLSKAEVGDLIGKVKEKTTPGGFNVYTYKYFNEEFPRPDEFRAARYLDSLGPNELREYYADWEIIRYDVYAKWDSHPGIPIHCHPVEKLVARKPRRVASMPYTVEQVPVQANSLSDDIFTKLDIGMSQDKVRQLCGDPDVVNTVTTEGLQFGAFEAAAEHGYVLHQWYYGHTMIEIVDSKLRAKNRLKSSPVRVRFLQSST
jgi:tellurite methyltransferase